MKHHLRLDRLRNRLAVRRGDSVPLTIFLVEADAAHPAGTRVIWGGRAREIAYDPARGEPVLPPGRPRMVIIGAELDV